MKRTKDSTTDAEVASTSSIFAAAKDGDMGMLIEKVDEIRLILKRRERRERLRMFGAFLKSTISIAVVVLSAWYLYEYGDDLMVQVADQAAKSAATYAGQQSEGMLQQFRESLQLK